ncbi:MAG: ABC transporter permease [Methanomassiliicoccales archaeon]
MKSPSPATNGGDTSTAGRETPQIRGLIHSASASARNIWGILRASPLSLTGFIIALLYIITALTVAIGGNHVLPYNPLAIGTGPRLAPPSLAHPFGTDQLGRDQLSRVLAATPLDLGMGVAVVLIALGIGSTLGLVAGYSGGITESVIMRITDIFLSIPSLVLTLAIAVALGPSILHVIEALSVSWWASYSRLSRGQTLVAKNQLYVVAARACGTSETVILFRHVFRNIFDTLLIYMTMDIGTVILTFSTLSFLGVGILPPTPEWGSMVYYSEQYVLIAPWVPIIPGIAIFFSVFAFSLMGDALRDLLDPRTRRAMA